MIVPRLDSDGKFPEIYGKVQPCATLTYTAGNQTSGGTTSANLILFDTEVTKQRILHDNVTDSSRVQVIDGGLYEFRISVLVNPTASSSEFDLWLRKNGTNVANSCIHESMPKDGDQHISRTFILQLVADDYVEWVWCSRNDASLILETQAAGANPTTPVAPCAILTVSRVSL